MSGTFDYHPGPGARCSLLFGDDRRELHCGDCFTLVDNGEKKPVRIELSGDWYLIGVAPASASRWDGSGVEVER